MGMSVSRPSWRPIGAAVAVVVFLLSTQCAHLAKEGLAAATAAERVTGSRRIAKGANSSSSLSSPSAEGVGPDESRGSMTGSGAGNATSSPPSSAEWRWASELSAMLGARARPEMLEAAISSTRGEASEEQRGAIFAESSRGSASSSSAVAASEAGQVQGSAAAEAPVPQPLHEEAVPSSAAAEAPVPQPLHEEEAAPSSAVPNPAPEPLPAEVPAVAAPVPGASGADLAVADRGPDPEASSDLAVAAAASAAEREEGKEEEASAEGDGSGKGGAGLADDERKDGVLHFLFTVADSLPHAAMWREFLAHAPPGAWRAWVHCTDREACVRGNITQELDGLTLVATVPSQRCTDLVTPQWKLVAEAARQTRSSGGASDKFIFVSQSCLPIKPFVFLRSTLMNSTESDICLANPRKEWQSTKIGGVRLYLVKHSQWAVLTRQHAERFAKKWTRLDARGRWNFMAQGSLLPFTRIHVDRNDRHNWRCADEFALFATVFGLYIPGKYSPAQCPLNRSITCGSQIELWKQSRCRTSFFFWVDDPYEAREFTLLKKGLIKEGQGGLHFVGDGHAAEFRRATPRIWALLRASPFLFARKFPSDAELPGFAEALYH